MDDNSSERFEVVGAKERDHIEFRRNYSPIQEPPIEGYPFKNPLRQDEFWKHYLTEQQAWDKAQQAARAAGDEYRKNMNIPVEKDQQTAEQKRQVRRCEEKALQEAWLKEWHTAEQAGLEMLQCDREAQADQLQKTEAALGDPALSPEQRASLEHQREQEKGKLEETKEKLQAWEQEMAVRARRNNEGSRAMDLELVGLAFSGGGIRSATFNLGLLQGLAELDLLKFVDYLSTVSGGGYIGGWLAAWCMHGGGMAKIAPQLTTDGSRKNSSSSSSPYTEPAPLRHLRRHSNYLAPRQGFLSADVWVLWATYLRNFLLNQLVLLPATVVVLLLVRLVMLLYYPWSHINDPFRKPDLMPDPTSLVLMTTFICGTAVLWFCIFVLLFRAALQVEAPGANADQGTDERLSASRLLVLTLLLLLGAFLFCSIAPYRLLEFVDGSFASMCLRCGLFALPCALLASVGFLIAAQSYSAAPHFRWNRAWRAAGAVFVAGFVGGALLYGVYLLLHSRYDWDGMLAIEYVHVRATAEVMTFGPPLVLVALVLAIYTGIGVSKGQLKEGLREWWSSVCGRLLAIAAVWAAICLVALYGPPLVLWTGPWMKTVLGSGWLLTVAGGVLAGKGSRTGPRRNSHPYLEWLARLAPYVFVVGLLIGVSLLLHNFLDNPPRWREADNIVWHRQIQTERPPHRVVLSRTEKNDGAQTGRERQDITEYTELIDDAFIIQQMYWVGILNMDANFVPRLQPYKLTQRDIDYRLKDQHHFEDRILEALRLHVQEKPFSSREDLEAKLDEIGRELPNGLSYEHRALILQLAKNVEWMKDKKEWGKLATKLGGWLLACEILLVLASWRVDVNLFSLHALYGNRLVRAYLGASRTVSSPNKPPLRNPNLVTGLDPKDDVSLAALAAKPFGPADKRQGYDGPYLLINTALNLVHGEDLAWQERKAEAFVMTPLYCGSETTGYRQTATAYSANVSLGNAITLSGAAASPNMGYHSSPAVAVLLTVFNACLGAWVGNPRQEKYWQRHGPWFGFLYLFREVFGLTNDQDGYVYLSDGGHFENLGAYELVRRRCRYIIVSDAEQDGNHAFEGLGNLIRKCRIDFGIRIEIDLNSLQLQGDSRRCRWHCAVGTIRYDDVDPHSAPGILVYVKPSLTGDEPADVLHYAGTHPTFPHESTGNQFYSESQFESYRVLGQHVARAIFEQSVADMNEDVPPSGEAPSDGRQRRCRTLFASVARRWFAMPPQFEAAFVESTHSFIDIQEAFRRDKRLRRLTFDLYPELKTALEEPELLMRKEDPQERAEREQAELFIITQMLQVMENAWLSLNLDVHYAHPLNRGWMDVFHRWTSAETVRRHWPILRSEFARGFVSFCEKQMRLGVVEGEPIPVRQARLAPQHLQRLRLEFTDQWPQEPDLQERLQPDQNAWLVYSKNSYPGQEMAWIDALPYGVIHLTRLADDGGLATYDFFVWMRGAYRNSGLGRTAVRKVLNRLQQQLCHDFRLRVRLPVGGLIGPGGKLQRSMWLTFFHHQNFTRVSPPGDMPSQLGSPDGEEIILEREFRRHTPALAVTLPDG